MPDFGTLLLYGKCPEAHLQAVEQTCQGCRTRDHYMEFMLYTLLQSGNRENFGIEAFNRQEEDCKVRGIGDIDVLLPDVLRLVQDPALQSLAESLH